MSTYHSIYDAYETFGVEAFYKDLKNYTNYHAEIIKSQLDQITPYLDLSRTLDLGCGDGLVSKHLKDCGTFIGCDPFMYQLYEQETGNKCFKYSFADIAQGKLLKEQFSTIIASFSLHLCNNDIIDHLLYCLGMSTNTLVIISPNKRPNVDSFVWEQTHEHYFDKVRLRVYNNKYRLHVNK